MKRRLDALLAWSLLIGWMIACGSDTTERLGPAVATVTVTELEAAYDANAIAADTRFKDKVITVSGVVTNIDKDIVGSPFVTLGTSVDDLLGAHATFARDATDQLSRLSKGQTVTVKCVGKGKLLSVLLDSCTLLR